MDSIAYEAKSTDTVEFIRSIALNPCKKSLIFGEYVQLEEKDAITKWKWDKVMTGDASYHMEFYDHVALNAIKDVSNGRNSCILSVGLDSSHQFRTVFGRDCLNVDAKYEPELSVKATFTASPAFEQAMEDHGQVGLVLLHLLRQYDLSLETSPTISLCFWMLANDTIIDLLRPNSKVHPRESTAEVLSACNVTRVTIKNADILSTLQEAKLKRVVAQEKRITADGEVLTHYFCTISIQSEMKSTTLSIINVANFQRLPVSVKGRSDFTDLDEVRKVIECYKPQADEKVRSDNAPSLDTINSSVAKQILLVLTANCKTYLHLNAINNTLQDSFAKDIIDSLAVSSSTTNAFGEKWTKSSSYEKTTADFDHTALIEPEDHSFAEICTPSSPICNPQEEASNPLINQSKQDVRSWLEAFTQQKLDIMGGEVDAVTPLRQLEQMKRCRDRERDEAQHLKARAEANTVSDTLWSDPNQWHLMPSEALGDNHCRQGSQLTPCAPTDTSNPDSDGHSDAPESTSDSRFSKVRPKDTTIHVKDNGLVEKSFNEAYDCVQSDEIDRIHEGRQCDPIECEYPMDSPSRSGMYHISEGTKKFPRNDDHANSYSRIERTKNDPNSWKWRPEYTTNETPSTINDIQAKISSSKERILRKNYDALLQIVQEQQKLRQIAQTDAQESKLREQETKTLLEIQMENLKLEIVALKRKLRMHEQTSNWAKVFDDYECEIERQRNGLSRLQDENARLEMRLATITCKDNYGTRLKTSKSALPPNMKKKLQQWFEEKQEAQNQLVALQKKERHFHIHEKLLNEATRKVEELSRYVQDHVKLCAALNVTLIARSKGRITIYIVNSWVRQG